MKPDLSVIPTREPVTANTAPRRPLTRAEYLQLCLDQNGRCACGCDTKLDAIREGVIDEHRIPRALGGSDELNNRELWRKPCSDKKTREADLPAIAKAKRLNGETCTGPTKPIPTHVNAWGPKGVRKLPKGRKLSTRSPRSA